MARIRAVARTKVGKITRAKGRTRARGGEAKEAGAAG